MSPFSPVRTGRAKVQAQLQGSEQFRPPYCLTLRGAGIENSVKKRFSVHASILRDCAIIIWRGGGGGVLKLAE